MNREIKFRAWNKVINKMVYFDLFSIGTNSPSTELRASIKQTETQDYYDTDFDDGEMENTILTQFTGLKDKNGKEIYEGDILRGNGDWDKPILVKWEGGGFHGVGGYKHVGFNFFNLFEIIGNIYENPELLK